MRGREREGREPKFGRQTRTSWTREFAVTLFKPAQSARRALTSVVLRCGRCCLLSNWRDRGGGVVRSRQHREDGSAGVGCECGEKPRSADASYKYGTLGLCATDSLSAVSACSSLSGLSTGTWVWER